MDDLLRIADEVATALADGEPVVALETTLVAHGFPAPSGVEVGLASEEAVRAAGAVPATIGVLDGRVVVGLTAKELERYTPEARKLGPRDIGVCIAQGALGATTVGGTLAVAEATGIRFMGTGGLGGVHRGYPFPPDVSADLGVCARTPALVASSGIKSLLDVPATLEVLETLGVPVIGYRTDTLPLFYQAHGGPRLTARAESPAELAAIADAHWRLDGGGIVVGRPHEESVDVAELIETVIEEARSLGVTGQAVTPYVLGALHERSEGETRRVNRDLIVENARLAGEVAVAYTLRRKEGA